MMKPSSLLGSVVTVLRTTVAALLLCGAATASAGYITTNSFKLNSIFSQPGFGLDDIVIRFNAPRTVVSASLLDINDDAEFNSLYDLAAYTDGPVVNMFFVDKISFCGSPGSRIIGCASTPGNVMVLDSLWAADAALGGNLAAHELAHNLGLPHQFPDEGWNLMNPTLSPSFALLALQITTILASPLVQYDFLDQRFISITPIAVVAVPEPQAWAMLSLGLLGLAGWVRRRKE